MNGNDIIPFGKYKGQPIEVLLNNPSYCHWLKEQEWFKEKFNNSPIYQIIINNFGETEATPEHNALQIRFNDKDFCFALAKLCNYHLMTKKSCIRNLDNAIRNARQKSQNYDHYNNYLENKITELREYKNTQNEFIEDETDLSLIDNKPYFKLTKSYEDGWDVVILTDVSECINDCPAFKEC